MKCIKSIKTTKNVEIGKIVRIDDIEAESKVKSGYWSYVPKSEWKLSKSKSKNNTQDADQATEQVTEEVTDKKKVTKKKSK